MRKAWNIRPVIRTLNPKKKKLSKQKIGPNLVSGRRNFDTINDILDGTKIAADCGHISMICCKKISF
jgi:hypothetical protein